MSLVTSLAPQFKWLDNTFNTKNLGGQLLGAQGALIASKPVSKIKVWELYIPPVFLTGGLKSPKRARNMAGFDGPMKVCQQIGEKDSIQSVC